MASVSGNTTGLKSAQIRTLDRLTGKRISVDEVISREIARTVCGFSSETGRQVGLLIHRNGAVEQVIVGDHEHIVIPALSRVRTSGSRLRGLRCIHTCFRRGLNEEDLMDMVFLRLDMMAVLTMTDGGLPELLHCAHLVPEPVDGKDWLFLDPVHPANQNLSCLALIEALEQEFVKARPVKDVDKGRDRAICVSVTTGNKIEARESMAELEELARSDGVIVLDRVIQHRRKLHSRFILGRGKLMEIMLLCLRRGANLLIFDQELSPSQVRSVTDHTDMRVIDRTQLILDIFAHRARSREGKLQIEMAQLKYMLPRLSTRDDALSRLTGGIGARGPGETKLEIDRRRISDRLARLSRELKKVGKERYHRRSRRRKRDIPVISLVGYTNAGKSTLLNSLTGSEIMAEDLLFATLDPTSRRLRFPRDMEVIITDTVGFIRNLPADLLKAFESTLEELFEADLLVHVIDAASPYWQDQTSIVEKLLEELELNNIPRLKVFNKADLLDEERLRQIRLQDGILISAKNPETLRPFLEKAENMLGNNLETYATE